MVYRSGRDDPLLPVFHTSLTDRIPPVIPPLCADGDSPLRVLCAHGGAAHSDILRVRCMGKTVVGQSGCECSWELLVGAGMLAGGRVSME